MRGLTMNEINTIFSQEYLASSVRKNKSAVDALMYVKNDI